MNPLIASIAYCYVGCNPGSPDSQALHVLKCDTSSGAVEIVQSVKGVSGTTYFQFDGKASALYSVVSETRNGKKASALVKFPLDGSGLGAMCRLSELPCEAPCHVGISPDSRQIAFAAYVSATVGVAPAGGGAPLTAVLPDVGMGSDAGRQQKAYAHFAFYTPDAKKVGFIDLGCDKIHFFDAATMKSVPGMSIKADSGDGPRHAVWSKDFRHLFVLNELSSTVASYAFDGTTFKRVCKLSMLPADFGGWSKASAIKLTSDGKILMAANRGHDSIAFYRTSPDGKLSLVNIAKLGGKFPRDFELMPGEKFMVVGHKMSNEIQVYRFDRAACTLTACGKPVEAFKPLCFKFRENPR